MAALATELSRVAKESLPNVAHHIAATLKFVTTEADYAAHVAAAARAAAAVVAELTPADTKRARDLGRTVNALARRVTGGLSALTIDGAPAVDSSAIPDPAARAAFETGMAA